MTESSNQYETTQRAFKSSVNIPMLSLRRWVTVLVGAVFGKTESFSPFISDAMKPVGVFIASLVVLLKL